MFFSPPEDIVAEKEGVQEDDKGDHQKRAGERDRQEGGEEDRSTAFGDGRRGKFNCT